MPGPRSIINAADFASGADLWAYVKKFDDDYPNSWERYMEFHEWRKGAMEVFLQVRGRARGGRGGAPRERSSRPQEARKLPLSRPRHIHAQDENGQGYAIGTGQGVSRNIVPAALRVPRIERYAAKPLVNSTAVPALQEVEQGLLAESFNAVAGDTWRAFRRHLDHCVHYSECRMCELVTLLT